MYSLHAPIRAVDCLAEERILALLLDRSAAGRQFGVAVLVAWRAVFVARSR